MSVIGENIKEVLADIEEAKKGQRVSFEEILNEVNARDWQDMHRETDPLTVAEDAVVVDSSDIGFEETVEKILKIAEAYL